MGVHKGTDKGPVIPAGSPSNGSPNIERPIPRKRPGDISSTVETVEVWDSSRVPSQAGDSTVGDCLRDFSRGAAIGSEQVTSIHTRLVRQPDSRCRTAQGERYAI